MLQFATCSTFGSTSSEFRGRQGGRMIVVIIAWERNKAIYPERNTRTGKGVRMNAVAALSLHLCLLVLCEQNNGPAL